MTNLGTEFGVEVDKRGLATTQVFRGKVEFVATGGGVENGKIAVVLGENESARTEKPRNFNSSQDSVVVIRRVAADPKAFVRRMVEPPKTLDLLDIVAGGNGLGNRRERGIDPTTDREDVLLQAARRWDSGRYQRTGSCELIDGVFIPNGATGPVVLDSAGHMFHFPATSGASRGSI